MDFLIEEKEFNLSLLHANHILESAIGLFNINTFYCESTDIVYEASLSDMIDSAVKAIEKIIQAIVDFCSSAISKVKSFFLKKEHQSKIDALVKNIDKIENPNEKISIYESEKLQKAFNVYIREVLKIERKISLLKLDATVSKNPTSSNSFIIECHKIMKEMNELNEKFEAVLTNETEPIIQMAKKDAVRFSQKELDNVKVDFDAVEKGSKEVLQKFKVDMNGCEVPVKINMFQKIANKVATNTRRVVTKITTYKHKNLLKIIGSVALTVGAISTGKAMVNVKRHLDSESGGQNVEYQPSGNPIVDKLSRAGIKGAHKLKENTEKNKKQTEMIMRVNSLIKEMRERLKNNDVEGATKIKAQIDELQTKINNKEFD